MKKRLRDLLEVCISGDAVRHRFKDYLDEQPKDPCDPEHPEHPLKLDDLVEKNWFKSELLDFCVMNPTCISKVRA